MERRKLYGTIIGVTSFVLIILGITYAYFYWSSDEDDRTNVNLTVTKGLENAIVYKQGESILGTDNRTLEPSDSYTGGISATIEFWKKENVTETIYGQIYLEILQMLSAKNTTNTNISKTNTIKWAITTYTTDEPTEVLLQEGTFHGRQQGDKFPSVYNIDLNNKQTFYKIYIWFDSSAVDNNFSVLNELLSVEISATASDSLSHYGKVPYQVLVTLGIDNKFKETTPDFTTISPVVASYKKSIASNRSVTLNSTITGNRTLGTGIEFNPTTGQYTLTGVSNNQSYNNNAVGKYTCGTGTACETVYKINAVKLSNATTNYSESGWSVYPNKLESNANRTIATSYSFNTSTGVFTLENIVATSASYSTDYVSTNDVSYYVCNSPNSTSCNAIYKILAVDGTTVTESRRNGNVPNYNEVTNADIYTQTIDTFNEADIGIFFSEDDLGASYYFRGNVDYNYVKFGKNSAGNDMYWRIIRINGDGSIRMIYDGTSAHANGVSTTNKQIGTSAFNDPVQNLTVNALVGYMYGDIIGNTYEVTHANTNNSKIKGYLTDWYINNIENTGYSSYVADAIYCNDRSLVSGSGILNEYTQYGATSRQNPPSLICTNANDKFTLSSNIGNGLIGSPIGLITSDEVKFAGGSDTSNNRYYLYSGTNYWTMTPSQFITSLANNYNITSVGTVSTNGLVSASLGVRPVISLKADAIKFGTGTMNDPFRITND